MSTPTNAINCNSTNYGVVSFDGVRIFQTIPPSTSGNVLTSNGSAWVSSPVSSSGAVTTLTGNTGGAISPTAGNINIVGTGSASVAGSGSTLTISVEAGGGLTLGAFGSTPNANGLSLSSGVLNMQPADATNPGGISTTTQTIAGAKTFTGAFTVSSGTGAISISGDAAVTGISIGTGAGAKTITIGSSTSGTNTSVISGSGQQLFLANSVSNITITGPGRINLNSGNQQIGLFSGSGQILIGTDAVAHQVFVNNMNGGSSTIVQSGTGGITIQSLNSTVAITSGTGAVNISADSTNNTINVGTGAGIKTLNLGSTTSSSSTSVNCGTGGCNVGTSANAHATTVGSTTALSTTTIQGPSGGVFALGVAGVTPSNINMVTINTSTGQLGSQAISSSGGGFTWTNVTGTTQTVAAGQAYLSNNAGTVTFTLPASATIGDVFRIVGVQGAWVLAQNASQQVLFSSSATTVGVGGSLSSTNAGDCVELVATNTSSSAVWRVMSSIGSITVV